MSAKFLFCETDFGRSRTSGTFFRSSFTLVNSGAQNFRSLDLGLKIGFTKQKLLNLLPAVKLAGLFSIITFVLCEKAVAAPWDIDMYRQQSLKAGEVARAPAEGTVPLGYQPFTLTLEEAEKSLQNPTEFNRDSVWRGKRLWNANCLTCHGATAKGDGPVGPQLAVPDITLDFYRQKSDGSAFGVIHLGVRAMPRYGYKFSTTQIWDLVNYLRFLQGKDVEGMVRPAQ